MSAFTLVIGNRNYSSWSLRPWLSMKMAGMEFAELVIPLLGTRRRRRSPGIRPGARCRRSGTAISSSGNRSPFSSTSPKQSRRRASGPSSDRRAVARAVSAEMHAGFVALRAHMPMNIRGSKRGRGRTPEVEADIRRIIAMWEDCRTRFGTGGPFLFGAFGNADAMYAPVVTRFNTYGVALEGDARLRRRDPGSAADAGVVRRGGGRALDDRGDRRRLRAIVRRCCARAACEA
jgi:glutathione S-transferase